MEKEIIRRFIGKKVVFHKVGSDINYIGILLEVTDSSMLVEFRGMLQTHFLEHVIDIQEGFNNNSEVSK